MLVIGRAKGEAFTVDGPATITITEIQGHRVKIAIDAPLTTKVLRLELVGTEPKPKEKPDASDNRPGK